jgi:hypothetical protein
MHFDNRSLSQIAVYAQFIVTNMTIEANKFEQASKKALSFSVTELFKPLGNLTQRTYRTF